MGHPHLQRLHWLKTKLIESNEKLEESNRCIASLRAQYASIEAESTENIASLRVQCAHDHEERERVAVSSKRNCQNLGTSSLTQYKQDKTQ